ncbi:T9SS type A sorting domain-containing protein [Psychroflexus aestuariivivens]|uniref:T9SS type A sorting domain-containing protein n=1 Tax=Psychroflexus aestuariivivens TaxID=1795040 RepID=UPI000FD771DE|nr:T9SS type A sorting domain-containing protein [Psychroflexus aestuariivivens]
MISSIYHKLGINPAILLIILLSVEHVQAQYSSVSTVAAETNVSNSANAVDSGILPPVDTRGDLTTFATLNATNANTSSSINLKFITDVPAFSTTFVRISNGPTSANPGLLDVLVAGSLGASGEIITPVVNLNQSISVTVLDAVVSVFSGSSSNNFEGVNATNDIKIVQDNLGDFYIAIYSSQSFSNLIVSNNGPATIDLSENYNFNVHGAFYRDNSNNCNTPKYTSWDGTGLASVSLLNSPAKDISNFIDGDFTTFSTLNTGLIGVAATVTQTVYLEGLSNALDTYHITLKVPTGVLSIGIAQNITIAAYEGNDLVDSKTLFELLDINILNLENNEKVSVSYNPGGAVDNIKVSISSLVGVSLLSELQLYEISKNTTLVSTDYATNIASNTATLNASLNHDSCFDSKGFEYSTTPNFLAGTVTTINSGTSFTSTYSENILGLTPSTTYYYRAKANSTINGSSIVLYGNTYSFFTGSITWDGNVWSNVTGPDATDSSNGIATLNGNYNTDLNGSLAVHDLTINASNILTVTGNKPLTISGSLIGPAESVDASSGEMIFTGQDNIVLDGDILIDQDGVSDNSNGHQIDKLQVSTSPGAELQILNEVELITSLDLGTDGVLALQDNAELIFNSDASGTAILAQINGTCVDTRITYGSDAGVTVERYIPAGSTEGGTIAVRAYRMLTSAVDAGTINTNWQEGDVDNQYNTGSNSLGNIEDFGTHITGGSNSLGFDYNATGNSSIYSYNNQTQIWSALNNTNATNLNAGDPYYINIRGDRTVNMSTNDPSPISTTIRTKGTLKLCDIDITSASLASGDDEFSFFGNPYQAPVDMNKVLTNTGTSEINPNYIWVWDPNLATKGAYVVVNVADDSKSNPSSNANRFLQAGQAIFVANSSSVSGTPNLSFEEKDKNIEEDNISVFSVPFNINSYNLNIQLKNGSNVLDAISIDFNNSNDNLVNDFDARKLGNADENLAVINGNNFLCIEKRELPLDQEEISLYLGSHRYNNYQFHIDWEVIPQTQAFLVDEYLQTSTLLQNGSNTINFSVDDLIQESLASNRFKLVFTNDNLSSSNEKDLIFSMYPNPVYDGKLNISQANFLGEIEVSIYDSIGQLIHCKTYDTASGNATINLNEFVSGIYFVKAKTEKAFSLKKIIKY